MKKMIDACRRRGVRGTTAAGFRRLAAALDCSNDTIKQHASPESPVKQSVWTEYLEWLTFCVPGMLHRGNVDAMAFALQHLPKWGADA